MAIDDKLRITREQYSKFIDDHDTIKQFEKLFEYINTFVIPEIPEEGGSVQTFDISSSDQTMTLPEITGQYQTVDFFWSGGDGTYTATLATTGSETVGGLPASTWTGEGEGSITCISDGTNWEVNVYNDYIQVADSGNFSEREVRKYVDGRKTETFTADYNGQTGTSNSNKYGTTAGNTNRYEETLTFQSAFIGNLPKFKGGYPSNAVDIAYNNLTLSNVSIRGYDQTGTFATDPFYGEFEGRWRT